MADQREAFEAKLAHEGEAVIGQAPLGVGLVIGSALGLGAFSIASQVRANDRPGSGKLRSNTMPGGVGAWMPM